MRALRAPTSFVQTLRKSPQSLGSPPGCVSMASQARPTKAKLRPAMATMAATRRLALAKPVSLAAASGSDSITEPATTFFTIFTATARGGLAL
eukprot:CAMPEP_0115389684 /NCGR_PEP_ID=MMETSP0271-20121206/9814_1 /TAXON_ID=71861 /ORGANISM="Scrippsiella trochoidea, Strain CCMP3099" /LENGTH=92 /DNA_ID=CAMNT_0002813205 /DNA_START=573 /DNA_END=851 /DNA_ORIENTATION=-